MKHALLLSGSLGAGHDVHARACASSLAGRGWSTETLDAMQLLGPRGGMAGEAVFRALLAMPGAYDAFHFAALRPGSRLALLADAAARRQLVPRLRGFLDSHPPAQDHARAELGLPGQDRAVLLMSGAWGLGPLAETAAALADAGVQVLAVAGRNARLEGRLRAAASHRPRLHVFGYTEQIPALMAAADLVITSSGDTCAEARLVGRPLLLLDVVQGHGRDNVQHELELGDAAVTSARPAEVLRCALAALDRAKPPSPGAPRPLPDWEDSFWAAVESMGLNGT
jgi:UDP-N-acetylglucosamine:LPS N-acetylglucosamine transferase